MTTFNQGRATAEFLISEAGVSRESVIVSMTGAKLESGTLMGKVTASGKWVPYNNGASDGSQAVGGVLYHTLPLATGDVKAVLIARQAEVAEDALTGLDAAARVDLAALTIILR